MERRFVEPSEFRVKNDLKLRGFAKRGLDSCLEGLTVQRAKWGRIEKDLCSAESAAAGECSLSALAASRNHEQRRERRHRLSDELPKRRASSALRIDPDVVLVRIRNRRERACEDAQLYIRQIRLEHRLLHAVGVTERGARQLSPALVAGGEVGRLRVAALVPTMAACRSKIDHKLRSISSPLRLGNRSQTCRRSYNSGVLATM